MFHSRHSLEHLVEYNDNEQRGPTSPRTGALTESVCAIFVAASTHQSDTDHDTVEDDTGLQKEHLMILFGCESSVKVVTVGIMMSRMRGVRRLLLSVARTGLAAVAGWRLQWMAVMLAMRDPRPDEIEQKGDDSRRHGNGRRR